MPVAESIRGFKEILEGKHDDVPERAFFMKGTIDEVVESVKGGSGRDSDEGSEESSEADAQTTSEGDAQTTSEGDAQTTSEAGSGDDSDREDSGSD